MKPEVAAAAAEPAIAAVVEPVAKPAPPSEPIMAATSIEAVSMAAATLATAEEWLQFAGNSGIAIRDVADATADGRGLRLNGRFETGIRLIVDTHILQAAQAG